MFRKISLPAVPSFTCSLYAPQIFSASGSRLSVSQKPCLAGERSGMATWASLSSCFMSWVRWCTYLPENIWIKAATFCVVLTRTT